MTTHRMMQSGTERKIVAREPGQTPWLSVVLGYGPMLPFLAGAGLAWSLGGERSDAFATLTTLWGCAILTFLAGVRRGVSFRTEGGPTVVQIGTMFGLFCLGFAALLAVAFGLPSSALVLLLVGFLAIAVLDPIAAKRGAAPLFFEHLRPFQMPLEPFSTGLQRLRCWRVDGLWEPVDALSPLGRSA